MANLYEILGVSSLANDNDIRTGYIKESLKYHPDRNAAPDATEKFQAVANAYYVLSDKDRRAKYDQDHRLELTETVNPFTIFADMFNDLMVPEVPNPSYFWEPVGKIAGIMMGFIVLNIPGSIIGYYYGGKAGKVRDMKGVSVYDAFCKLSADKRAAILGDLGKKFITTAAGAAISHK